MIKWFNIYKWNASLSPMVEMHVPHMQSHLCPDAGAGTLLCVMQVIKSNSFYNSKNISTLFWQNMSLFL